MASVIRCVCAYVSRRFRNLIAPLQGARFGDVALSTQLTPAGWAKDVPPIRSFVRHENLSFGARALRLPRLWSLAARQHPSFRRHVLRLLSLPFLLATTSAAFARTDITVWGINVGADNKGQEAQVHAFETRFPQYHVRLLSMGAGNMDPQKLMTSIVGRVPPDVIFQDRFTIGDWASRGAFRPLDDLMARDNKDPNDPRPDQYYPAIWHEATYGGKVYGIPYQTDDRAFYYNKAIFREKADALRAAGLDPSRPPRTWSELLAYSKALTEYNTDGTLKRAGFLPNFGDSWLYLYSFEENGSFLSADGHTCTFDTPANERALQFMVDGYDLEGGYENSKAFESGFLSDANDPFILGKVAMKIDGNWILGALMRYGPSLDFAVAPAPAPDDRYYQRGEFAKEKQKFVTWTGGFCYSIPTGARNVEGAWEFIKFCQSKEGRLTDNRAQLQWENHMGRAYVPLLAANIAANKAIYNQFKPAVPKFAAAFKEHIDLLAYTRTRPPTFIAQELWDQQVKATEDACLHKTSVAGALRASQAVIQRDLDAFYNEAKYPVLNLWIPFYLLLFVFVAGLLLCFVLYRRLRLRAVARAEARWGYLFISPWAIGFLVFTIGPMLASLLFSFTQFNVLTPAHWVGGRNYQDLVTTDWGPTFKAFSNVAYLAAVGVPLGIVTGLAVALLLNTGVRGIRFYRTLFYMPAIVPTVASSILWIWLLFSDPHKGLLNGVWDETITRWMGLAPPGWLDAEAWAKPALILMGLWGAGSGMILWLAGLKGIPSSLYEAAAIDGAKPRQQFWSITMPQLSPILFFNIVIGFIGALQEFDRIYIMKQDTPSGPGESLLVPVLQLFQNGFGYFKMGYASAIAWVIFAIILALTLAQFRLARHWVHYEAEE